jgi:peptidoglycan/xylan/chitin deacetylase (PgdA/CDA1 family)
MKRALATTLSLSVMLAAAEQQSYSQTPPGELNVKNVPQFVVIGADDCGNAETIRWILDYIKEKKNPAGTGKLPYDGKELRMAFYVNGQYAEEAGEAWKEAYEAGHEIGNHTFSHFLDKEGEPVDARKLDSDTWYKEIVKNDSVILKATGMKKSELVGFRVPRLEYNRGAYEAMVKRGFLYDCSIEEGSEPGMDGTNNFWPYTMDKGSLSDSLQAEWSVGEDDWGYKKVGKIEGIWQLPVYNFVVPHDSLAEKYSFESGLRGRIHNNFDYFDTTTGALTGFDYNIFAPADWDGAAMKAEEFSAKLMNSFDLHINGNRTPFTLGMHPDFYAKSEDEYYSSAGDYKSRRAVIEKFIDYALTQPDVRFVTGAQVIEWMQNPIGLDGTKIK